MIMLTLMLQVNNRSELYGSLLQVLLKLKLTRYISKYLFLQTSVTGAKQSMCERQVGYCKDGERHFFSIVKELKDIRAKIF